MSAARERVIRASSILLGSLLVVAFLSWIVMRAAGTLVPGFGMETASGWIAHIAAVLVLLAGLALLARGIFGRAREENAGPTAETE